MGAISSSTWLIDTMELDNFLQIRAALAAPMLTIVLFCTYLAWVAAYNILFHPLHKYPGPKFWAISRIPLARAQISGTAHCRVLRLHRKYGDIVRVAPDEISYSHPDAWDDIYGPRKRDRAECSKDPIFYDIVGYSIVGADDQTHARLRRILSHGFSAQALQAQEPLIKVYVDQLIEQFRMRSACKGEKKKKPVELTSWMNYTTFDVIGDLSFGEPFGMVAGGEYHPWVSTVLQHNRDALFYTAAKHFSPLLSGLLASTVPRSVLQKLHDHWRMTREKVAKRKAAETDRPDIMDAMLHKGGSQKMTDEELANNASLLVIAGAESTATTVCSATYFLATNPDAMHKLVEEIRNKFQTDAEINLLNVQQLVYLRAVVEETLRLHPPNPAGLPRRAPAGGIKVLGQYVPAGTLMSVWQWPLYHNAKWFHQPDSFMPERWLGGGDARFANDRLDGVQPFVTGPRNCIGQNLAYAEIRLILCRLFWNFEVELAEESKNWIKEQKTYLVWKKGALNVLLISRRV